MAQSGSRGMVSCLTFHLCPIFLNVISFDDFGCGLPKEGQKEALDALKLELQMGISHRVGAGNQN